MQALNSVLRLDAHTTSHVNGDHVVINVDGVPVVDIFVYDGVAARDFGRVLIAAGDYVSKRDTDDP